EGVRPGAVPVAHDRNRTAVGRDALQQHVELVRVHQRRVAGYEQNAVEPLPDGVLDSDPRGRGLTSLRAVTQHGRHAARGGAAAEARRLSAASAGVGAADGCSPATTPSGRPSYAARTPAPTAGRPAPAMIGSVGTLTARASATRLTATARGWVSRGAS